jgi:hypothetical protein
MDVYSSLEMEVLVRCMPLNKAVFFSPSTVHMISVVMFSNTKTFQAQPRRPVPY